VSTSAQKVSSSSGQVAVSPEVDAVLRLMFGPGVEFNTRKVGLKTVAASLEGGQDERRFSIIPTERSPRALLPLGSPRCTIKAVDQVRAFAPSAKAAKGLLRIAATVGVLPKIAGTLSVIGCGDSNVFSRAAQIAGQPNATFAVVFGTPSKYRKLVACIMSPDGTPVSFVKVPMAQPAVKRIEHEGQMLEALSKTFLEDAIPRVLFRGCWNGETALCLSAGPNNASPMQLGLKHYSLLKKMWGVRPIRREGKDLVDEVSGVAKTIPSATRGGDFINVVSEALERASRELRRVTVSCGLSHGDFAPWNLRRGQDELFAFDWEASSWECPNVWDIAHFDTQVVTLLGHKSCYSDVTRGIPSASSLYLLYLVKSLAEAASESGISSTQVSHRFRLLRTALKN